jgi:hypothetical protein
MGSVHPCGCELYPTWLAKHDRQRETYESKQGHLDCCAASGSHLGCFASAGAAMVLGV